MRNVSKLLRLYEFRPFNTAVYLYSPLLYRLYPRLLLLALYIIILGLYRHLKLSCSAENYSRNVFFNVYKRFLFLSRFYVKNFFWETFSFIYAVKHHVLDNGGTPNG